MFSHVLRAAFIIITATVICYTTSEAYLIKYRPPYGNIYMQAVKEILKRQNAQPVRGHIWPLPVDNGELLNINETDIKTEENSRERKYSLASLKFERVRDIHLKVDVVEMDNELPPANANKK